MIGGEVAVRYSKALFHLSASPAEQERRLSDLENLVTVIKKLPKLKFFLSAPQISLAQKKDALGQSLGEHIDRALLNFLFFLLDKGRIQFLEGITGQYRKMVKENVGVIEADLITSVPVGKEFQEKLVKRLENSFHKKIELKQKQDPAILGGAILILANRVIDWSIKNKIHRLKDRLLETKLT